MPYPELVFSDQPVIKFSLTLCALARHIIGGRSESAAADDG
jgi:hypothetical protein